ncbi:MAG: hypothetical protein ACRD1B_07525 [Thermoanaerobaculia bacterium]
MAEAAAGGRELEEQVCRYPIVMWNDELLGDSLYPFLWFHCSDPKEAVRIATALTEEDRLRGVPEGKANLFWACDERGGYLGGDTWRPDRPQGAWPLARVLDFNTRRRRR